jgi:hypothetical protein
MERGHPARNERSRSIGGNSTATKRMKFTFNKSPQKGTKVTKLFSALFVSFCGDTSFIMDIMERGHPARNGRSRRPKGNAPADAGATDKKRASCRRRRSRPKPVISAFFISNNISGFCLNGISL